MTEAKKGTKFVYPLQTLLKVRKIREKQEQEKFKEAEKKAKEEKKRAQRNTKPSLYRFT